MSTTPTHTCRSLTLTNIKGGVGKTTSAIFLAFGLASQGYRTLLLDMDPQANATYTLTGQLNEQPEDTLYEVIREKSPRSLQEIIKPTSHENLFIAPGSLMLSSSEVELVSVSLREFKLKAAVDQIKPYFHFVVIDTPPNLGLLTVNALVASTDVIIPVTTKVYGLVGINILLNTLDILRSKFEPFGVSLPILGVLVNQIRPTNNSLERQRQLEEIFQEKVFKNTVPFNEKIEESNDQQESGYKFAPNAKGVLAYSEIVKEVIERVSR